MALLLGEDDVRAVLTMSNTIQALEQAFIELAQDKALNRPRTRMHVENGVMHLMAASIPTMGVMGYKAYTVFRSGMRYAVMLYSTLDGRLLAILDAEWLGGLRTGATSALATRYMARPDASVVGLIGSGRQAMAQLSGICGVRQVTRVNVYSRRLPECEEFCNQMSRGLHIQVRPVASPREAVEEADIVVTATSSAKPVFPGDWLKVGCHINAIGSNWANRREIDLAALQRCDLVVTDSREQAQVEAGDLILPADEGLFDFNNVRELADVIAGHTPSRQAASDITLYKGIGIALEDVAAAGLAYRLARERGLGEEINLIS